MLERERSDGSIIYAQILLNRIGHGKLNDLNGSCDGSWSMTPQVSTQQFSHPRLVLKQSIQVGIPRYNTYLFKECIWKDVSVVWVEAEVNSGGVMSSDGLCLFGDIVAVHELPTSRPLLRRKSVSIGVTISW